MGLVALEDLQSYLGVGASADDTLLDLILTRVELRFLRATNRLERPFQAAQLARAEVLDGSGGPLLFLAYPIAVLSTVITLGYASPWDESLTPSDPLVIQYQVGSRRVARVDGKKFGTLDKPGYVRVTYDAQADQPEDLKLLLLRFAASVWRESNGDEARTERVNNELEELPLPADMTQDWNQAVGVYWEPRI